MKSLWKWRALARLLRTFYGKRNTSEVNWIINILLSLLKQDRVVIKASDLAAQIEGFTTLLEWHRNLNGMVTNDLNSVRKQVEGYVVSLSETKKELKETKDDLEAVTVRANACEEKHRQDAITIQRQQEQINELTRKVSELGK